MNMLTLAILNFNGQDTLENSIDSVLNQSFKLDRFVVIDNASTDLSRGIAIRKKVEVIDADNKYKFITGLNTALDLCKERLFFMQNDVVLDKDCIKNMMENSPYLNFMSQPVIYDELGKIDNSGMDFYWPGYGIRRNKKWWNEGNKFQKCGLVTTICFMIDSLAIRHHRKFDTLFEPAYYEDIDFWIRSTKKPYPAEHVLIPSAKAIHKGNHTFSQTYKKSEISNICRINRVKLINKHYTGVDRWLRLAVNSGINVTKKSIDVILSRWALRNNRD